MRFINPVFSYINNQLVKFDNENKKYYYNGSYCFGNICYCFMQRQRF